MRFEGNGRIIQVIGDKVIISTSNSLIGRLDSKNNKDLEINLNEITSIDCKNASLFSNGYIKLYVNGKASIQTTIMFFPKTGVYQEAMSFVTRLEEMKRAKKTNTSSADELKKYKELLDMGAITPEEYDKKKKQLLNL